MTIDVGEALCGSWLKHVKMCQVVQTNWKPSCFWIEEMFAFVERALKELDTNFSKKKFHVFPHKKRKVGRKYVDDGIDARQIMEMSECDVIGIQFDRDGNVVRVYGVESAFHSDGLHYKATAEKVTAKIVKTILALYLYVGAKNIEVAFITPVVKESVAKNLEKLLNEVRLYFSKCICAKRFKCQIDFYTESQQDNLLSKGFKSLFQEVVKPVMKNIPFIDDEGELFTRALLMSELSRGVKLPVRSSLRSALYSVGRSLERLSSTDMPEMGTLKSGEKSALKGYKRWLQSCPLLQTALPNKAAVTLPNPPGGCRIRKK